MFLAGNGVPGLGRHALRRAVYAVVCNGVRTYAAAVGAACLRAGGQPSPAMGWGSSRRSIFWWSELFWVKKKIYIYIKIFGPDRDAISES